MSAFSVFRILFCMVIGSIVPISATGAETVTIGVLAHRGDDFARARWSPTIAHLNNRMPDVEFKLLPLSLEGVRAALENAEINFLLTNPGHYYGISDAFRLTRVASLKTDRRGKPTTGNRYGAVIFVRSERSDIRSLGDLKGKSFAAVAPNAFGGFLAAAHILQKNGIDTGRDLKALKYLGFPQDEIVMAIIKGEEDAGTVRTGLLESMIADKRISAGDIRIINPQSIDGFNLMLSTDLFPEWTFAATQISTAALRKEVAMILFSISEDAEAARAGRYGGWNTPMYDGGVRQLLLAMQNNSRGQPVGYLLLFGTSLLALIAGLVIAYLFSRRAGRRPAQRLRSNRTQFLRLTPRENEVLTHVVAGNTNKEVARILDISPKTVEFHRKHLMKKLDAGSLADLVRIAVEREIFSQRDLGSEPRT